MGQELVQDQTKTLEQYVREKGINTVTFDGEDCYEFYKFFVVGDGGGLISPVQGVEYSENETYIEDDVNLNPRIDCGEGINVATIDFVLDTVARDEWNRGHNFGKTVVAPAYVPVDLEENEYCVPHDCQKVRVKKIQLGERKPWTDFIDFAGFFQAYKMGKDLNEIGEEELRGIAEKVAESSDYSYLAGCDWS
ncbi:MAG: hypothetical protein ACOC5T_06570, partial [Elusimicrobiota bacterium]